MEGEHTKYPKNWALGKEKTSTLRSRLASHLQSGRSPSVDYDTNQGSVSNKNYDSALLRDNDIRLATTTCSPKASGVLKELNESDYENERKRLKRVLELETALQVQVNGPRKARELALAEIFARKQEAARRIQQRFRKFAALPAEREGYLLVELWSANVPVNKTNTGGKGYAHGREGETKGSAKAGDLPVQKQSAETKPSSRSLKRPRKPLGDTQTFARILYGGEDILLKDQPVPLGQKTSSPLRQKLKVLQGDNCRLVVELLECNDINYRTSLGAAYVNISKVVNNGKNMRQTTVEMTYADSESLSVSKHSPASPKKTTKDRDRKRGKFGHIVLSILFFENLQGVEEHLEMHKPFQQSGRVFIEVLRAVNLMVMSPSPRQSDMEGIEDERDTFEDLRSQLFSPSLSVSFRLGSSLVQSGRDYLPIVVEPKKGDENGDAAVRQRATSLSVACDVAASPLKTSTTDTSSKVSPVNVNLVSLRHIHASSSADNDLCRSECASSTAFLVNSAFLDACSEFSIEVGQSARLSIQILHRPALTPAQAPKTAAPKISIGAAELNLSHILNRNDLSPESSSTPSPGGEQINRKFVIDLTLKQPEEEMARRFARVSQDAPVYYGSIELSIRFVPERSPRHNITRDGRPDVTSPKLSSLKEPDLPPPVLEPRSRRGTLRFRLLKVYDIPTAVKKRYLSMIHEEQTHSSTVTTSSTSLTSLSLHVLHGHRIVHKICPIPPFLFSTPSDSSSTLPWIGVPLDGTEQPVLRFAIVRERKSHAALSSDASAKPFLLGLCQLDTAVAVLSEKLEEHTFALDFGYGFPQYLLPSSPSSSLLESHPSVSARKAKALFGKVQVQLSFLSEKLQNLLISTGQSLFSRTGVVDLKVVSLAILNESPTGNRQGLLGSEERVKVLEASENMVSETVKNIEDAFDTTLSHYQLKIQCGAEEDKLYHVSADSLCRLEIVAGKCAQTFLTVFQMTTPPVESKEGPKCLGTAVFSLEDQLQILYRQAEEREKESRYFDVDEEEGQDESDRKLTNEQEIVYVTDVELDFTDQQCFFSEHKGRARLSLTFTPARAEEQKEAIIGQKVTALLPTGTETLPARDGIDNLTSMALPASAQEPAEEHQGSQPDIQFPIVKKSNALDALSGLDEEETTSCAEFSGEASGEDPTQAHSLERSNVVESSAVDSDTSAAATNVPGTSPEAPERSADSQLPLESSVTKDSVSTAEANERNAGVLASEIIEIRNETTSKGTPVVVSAAAETSAADTQVSAEGTETSADSDELSKSVKTPEVVSAASDAEHSAAVTQVAAPQCEPSTDDLSKDVSTPEVVSEVAAAQFSATDTQVSASSLEDVNNLILGTKMEPPRTDSILLEPILPAPESSQPKELQLFPDCLESFHSIDEKAARESFERSVEVKDATNLQPNSASEISDASPLSILGHDTQPSLASTEIFAVGKQLVETSDQSAADQPVSTESLPHTSVICTDDGKASSTNAAAVPMFQLPMEESSFLPTLEQENAHASAETSPNTPILPVSDRPIAPKEEQLPSTAESTVITTAETSAIDQEVAAAPKSSTDVPQEVPIINSESANILERSLPTTDLSSAVPITARLLEISATTPVATGAAGGSTSIELNANSRGTLELVGAVGPVAAAPIQPSPISSAAESFVSEIFPLSQVSASEHQPYSPGATPDTIFTPAPGVSNLQVADVPRDPSNGRELPTSAPTDPSPKGPSDKISVPSAASSIFDDLSQSESSFAILEAKDTAIEGADEQE